MTMSDGSNDAGGRLVAAPAGAPDRLQPPVSDVAIPFWEATRARVLVLQWCLACERPIHFPREACPSCLGVDLEYRTASGVGTVYASSTMPVPANPTMAGREPYVVALIDLAEGVRLLGNVVGEGATEVAVGAGVVVAWEPLVDGRHLPVFVVG